MKIEDLLSQVGPLDLKKPELMTAQQRWEFVNAAYDRANTSKMVTVRAGVPLQLAPGTYRIGLTGALTYTDSFANVWAITPGASMTLASTQTFLAGIDVQLDYFDNNNIQFGVPMALSVNENLGLLAFSIGFGCSGTGIERTAAGVFTRAYTINGPMQVSYTAAAGSLLQLSVNAYL